LRRIRKDGGAGRPKRGEDVRSYAQGFGGEKRIGKEIGKKEPVRLREEKKREKEKLVSSPQGRRRPGAKRKAL